MRFLIIAAFLAVASARPQDYHDDVFHFTTLKSQNAFSGLSQSNAFVQAAPAYSSFVSQPVLAKKVTVQKYSSAPQYSSFVSQPAYTQQYTVQQAAAPVLLKTVEQEIPAYTQQYAVQKVAQPVYTQQYSALQAAQPAVTQYSANQYSANQYSAQSNYAAGFAGPQVRILSQIHEIDPSGPYKVSYATDNGIQASEQGTLVNSAEGPVVASEGSYSWTGPDGVTYTTTWVADENGFRASGAHLPVSPPIPEEILRSLEANASSNERYDDQGRLLKK